MRASDFPLWLHAPVHSLFDNATTPPIGTLPLCPTPPAISPIPTPPNPTLMKPFDYTMWLQGPMLALPLTKSITLTMPQGNNFPMLIDE